MSSVLGLGLQTSSKSCDLTRIVTGKRTRLQGRRRHSTSTLLREGTLRGSVSDWSVTGSSSVFLLFTVDHYSSFIIIKRVLSDRLLSFFHSPSARI